MRFNINNTLQTPENQTNKGCSNETSRNNELESDIQWISDNQKRFEMIYNRVQNMLQPIQDEKETYKDFTNGMGPQIDNTPLNFQIIKENETYKDFTEGMDPQKDQASNLQEASRFSLGDWSAQAQKVTKQAQKVKTQALEAMERFRVTITN